MIETLWPRELRQALCGAGALQQRGWGQDLSPQQVAALESGLNIRIPAVYGPLWAEPQGPLAKQFLPDLKELEHGPGEILDPIGDEVYAPLKGVTHRYPDRVLLKPTLHCAVYCRFCFRRHKVAKEGWQMSAPEIAAALAYIRDNPKIREVILTGGDPLTLTDARLALLLRGLADIPHLMTLRVHTKVLTALASRITPELVALLGQSAKPIWWVAHINHPQELHSAAQEACLRLRRAGVPLLQQGVLLKGVNDDVQVLEDLFLALTSWGIKPYYLHYPDAAAGTGHFRPGLSQARELLLQLRGRIPGYAIPQLIVDIPGGFGKIDALGPNLYEAASGWMAISPLDGSHHRLAHAD